MRYFILMLCFVATSLFAKSQTGGNSIIGTVINTATHAPLEYSTITIFEKGKITALTGTTTDNSGSFSLTDIPPGTYRLVFENMGYQAYTLPELVLNKKDAIVDLKKITLKLQASTLETVVVSAKTNLVENKIDKMVFNAEKDLSSAGGVATDLLKKIPQVSVDAEGNVQLAGNSGIRFLINGKPSTAFGSNVADVLQSIPASQIKSIEVITSPGAKYDAQGMGGIINIILKSNSSQGYNGNISLTASSRTENGAFNFNVKKNDLAAHAFISGNKRLKSGVTNTNTRITKDSSNTTTLQQVSNSNFERHGMQAGAGIDWTYKKNNSFSGNISYDLFGNNGSGSTNQTLATDSTGAQTMLTKIQSGSAFKFHNTDLSFGYKRLFKKEDQELEFNITNSAGYNNGRSYAEQLPQPLNEINFGNYTIDPAKINETEASIDYTQPLPKEFKLAFGGKAVFYHIQSAADVKSYEPSDGSYQPNTSLSNSLNYKQKVYAAYAEVTIPVGKLFTARVGSRYEQTNINAYFSDAGQLINIPGYHTIVPSIFLFRKINNKTTIKLNYAKRIERPDYEDLNPYVNATDPKNLSTGNPYLKPEIGHRVELGFTSELGKTGSFMINIFYRINDHDIQPFVTYYPTYLAGDSLYKNVAVTMRQNIGTEKNMGANLFGDIHVTPAFSLRSNIFLFYRHTINAIDIGYNINSFNYRVNVNASYQFSNSLAGEFFANFNGARNEAQGRYPASTTYTMAFRKQLWKKKASIAFTASNIFGEYLRQKTILSGPDFTVNSERKIHIRSVGINFNWKFGKLEFKKNAEDHDLNGVKTD